MSEVDLEIEVDPVNNFLIPLPLLLSIGSGKFNHPNERNKEN